MRAPVRSACRRRSAACWRRRAGRRPRSCWSTPQGTRTFASLDELTREALGESVPIEAWFDWLRGRPWPAAASEPVAAPGGAAASAPVGFMQLGWRVDLSRFGEGAVTATRESPAPAVTARIRLDRP